MQFLYLNFFWIAPSTSAILLVQRRWPEFRAATFGIVACFFIGYALYVLFPAAPPRLVLVYQFTKNLRGYPVGFSALSAGAFSLLPVDSRAAFPSLHTAASTVALAYAWRHLRAWWFVLLPFVVGLWASTIYLRHHYFVDLVGRLAARRRGALAGAARRRLVGAAAARTRLRAGEGRRQAPVRRDEGPAERTGPSRRDDAAAYFAGCTSTDQACVPQASVSCWPSPFGANEIVNRSAGCADLAAVIATRTTSEPAIVFE